MDSPNEERNDDVQQQRSIPSPRRFYECSFCKRGFTNAQALGGHMNIHRRDRDPNYSSKPHPPPPPPPTKIPFSNSSRERPPVWVSESSSSSSAAANVYSRPAAGLIWQDSNNPRHHQQYPYVYFQQQVQGSHAMVPPTPESSQNQGVSSSVTAVSEQQVIWGANLSLQVGPAGSAELANNDHDDGDDVDLELRLGHH